MGREVIVGIYDKLMNTCTFDKFDNWFICGRNDFTNDLYSLFINRNVELLVLDIYGEGLDGKVIESPKDIGTDPGEYSKAMYIRLLNFEKIINEHIDKIKQERDLLQGRLNSLKKVRDNTRTLQDWLDIDTFLNELMEDEKDLKYSGQESLQSYISEAKEQCKIMNNSWKKNEFAPLLGPNPLGEAPPNTPRYYPIVLFSD